MISLIRDSRRKSSTARSAEQDATPRSESKSYIELKEANVGYGH